MSSGPLISSPVIDRRATRMAALRIEDVVRDSAVVVADKFVEPLRTAARAAGGSAALVSSVQTFDGHLNELVMRDAGHRGDVIVGIGGDSRHADEAEELEWGSIDQAPKAWVRMTAARRGHDVVGMWSNEMTRELDRRVG